MRVSIVTISFNQARYLPRAMASVLSQDYSDIEYIVVDPGSTDGSLEIIDRYAHRLAHVVLDPDDGPADGLNHGFALATGDIVAYINADDALLPGAVREAVDYLTANPDVDVVYGDGYIVDAEGGVVRTMESTPLNLRRYAYQIGMILQQATFIRRSAMDRVGGFNAANRTCWDGELIIDIALTGARIRHVRKWWGLFADYPETISGSQRLRDVAVLNTAHMFRKVHGRDRGPADGLIRRVAWVESWFATPGRTLRRLREIVTGPPRLRVVEGDDSRIELVVDQ